MRILMKSGTTESLLVDGPHRGVNKQVGPSALRIVAETQVDPKMRLRASYQVPVDRGNIGISVSFGMRRECSSHSAAAAWLLRHISTVLRSGTLYLIQTGPSNERIYLQVSNAVLRLADHAMDGVSVRVEYQIVGGELVLP
jgi:hypothetical protein